MPFGRRMRGSGGWVRALLVFSVGVAAALCALYSLSRPDRLHSVRAKMVLDLTAQAAQPSESAGNPVSLKACLANNGLAYSPFRDGQGPGSNLSFPSDVQITEDFAFLSRVTRHIRTYSSGDKYDIIPSLARKASLRVIQGIYLGGRRTKQADEKQIDSAVQMARDGLVDAIIVGNETLGARKALRLPRLK